MDILIIQILKFASSDELSDIQSLTDSACWETEPKKSADLDLYYEASSSIPVRLNNNSIIPFTSPNTRSSVAARVTVVDEGGSTIDLPPGSFVNDVAGNDAVQIFGGDGITPVISDIAIGDTLSFHHHNKTITKHTVSTLQNNLSKNTK